MSMKESNHMQVKVWTAIGIIMLVSFMTLGLFAFPIGIPVCSIIGLIYGIKKKDKLFTKWSIVALGIGIACMIYTLAVIKSM